MSVDRRLRVADAVVKSLNGNYATTSIGMFAASIFAPWLGRIPLLRARYDEYVKRQNRKRSSAICSQDVHRAYRMGGGICLCPHLDEALVSPNDIGRCRDLRYLGTLAWPGAWAKG